MKKLSNVYAVHQDAIEANVIEALQKTLTVKAELNENFGNQDKKELLLIDFQDEFVQVPRFFGLEFFGQPDVVEFAKDASAPRDSLSFSVELDAQRRQVEATDFVMDKFNAGPDGVMLVLPCGYGKTTCALHVCGQLRVRTMVIVPTSVLIDQWYGVIQQRMPDARVCVLRGSTDTVTEDARTADIVLTLVQTMSMCTLPAQLLSSFELMIVDEVHTACAPTFHRAVLRCNPAYILSLSATPERPDGLHVAMRYFLGSHVFRVERAHTPTQVQIVRYTNRATQIERSYSDRQGKKKLKIATMLNDLACDRQRTELLLMLIREKFEQGRLLIVLADRTSLLQSLHDALPSDVTGLLTGAVPQSKRAEQMTKPIILATYALCKMGFDKPDLNTLIMATPITNIEQSVGRIQRQTGSEHRPLIVDVIDNYSIFHAYFRKRKRYYDAHGFDVSLR